MPKFQKVRHSQPHRLLLCRRQRLIWFPHNTHPTFKDVHAKGSGPRPLIMTKILPETEKTCKTLIGCDEPKPIAP